MKKLSLAGVFMALLLMFGRVASASTTNAFTDMGTNAVTDFTTNDLNDVTTGATWSMYDAGMTNNIVADAGPSDYGLVFDTTGDPYGRDLQFDLTTPADFSSSRVDCRVSSAASRAGNGKHYTIYGYGPTNSVIFEIRANSKANYSVRLAPASLTNTGKSIAYFGSGGVYEPNKLRTITIALDPAAAAVSNLTYTIGNYVGSAGFLSDERKVSRIKCEITANIAKQGFWLDDVVIEAAADTSDTPGTTLILR
jgi:hypothetical protein